MPEKQKWCLIGKRGALKHKKIKLYGPQIIVGRMDENDIVIPEHAVSRNHAKIEFKDNHVWLSDLKSKNGTYVNQEKISIHKISDRDTLQIGAAKAIFKLEKSPSNTQHLHPIAAKALHYLQSSRHRLILAGVGLTLPILVQLLFIQPQKPVPTQQNPSEVSDQAQAQSTATNTDASFTPTVTNGPETSVSLDNVNLEELQQNLTSALSVEDYPAAFSLLKAITQLDPSPSNIDQLAEVEKKLKLKIAQYEENALREYEKLNYDKAITEWQKALSLAQNYDPNLKQKIEVQITEAQKKFAGN